MKLMKIFGMVFALHVVLACVLVLIQGCRSTTARAPEAAPAVIAAEPESENWSNQSPAQHQSSAPSAPPAYAPLSGLTPAERARAAPTRPDNPEAFIRTGTASEPAAPPAPPSTYVVRSGDSLWKIARTYGTTTGEIQKLNPNVKADSLRPGMTLRVPGTDGTGAPAASSMAPAAERPAGTTYVVRSGDSLSKIAARNGTTVSALRSANNLRTDVIQVGQTLTIPSAGAPADNPPGMFGENAAPDPNAVTVVVQRGDTLGEIARKFDVTVGELMDANNISDPRRVQVGQTLVIPGFEPVGTGAIPPDSPRPSTRPPPVMTAPPDRTPPAPDRPSELDTLPVESGAEAPPVVPIDEPTPSP